MVICDNRDDVTTTTPKRQLGKIYYNGSDNSEATTWKRQLGKIYYGGRGFKKLANKQSVTNLF